MAPPKTKGVRYRRIITPMRPLTPTMEGQRPPTIRCTFCPEEAAYFMRLEDVQGGGRVNLPMCDRHTTMLRVLSPDSVIEVVREAFTRWAGDVDQVETMREVVAKHKQAKAWQEYAHGRS